MFYVIVPPSCTDHLQPLDLSVNKPADFTKRKFQEWYASITLQQMEDKRIDPVDMRLSIMKPLVSRWAVEMYNFTSRPSIIVNRFREAGIVDILES